MSERDESEGVPAAPPAKKRGKLGIVLALVLTAALAGGGAFLAPRYLSLGSVAKAEPAAEAEPAINPLFAFQPIVVDIRGDDVEAHHLKVTLTFELADQVKAEDFEKVVPRGREAAIVYLRSQSYDDVTRADNFQKISTELTERVLAAVGKKRVRRMMITDFVTQ